MAKDTTKEEYHKRMNIIVEFIQNNLDKKISLNELAEISNLSQYHFHRITKALLGESIGCFIKRTRVETAARLIRYSDLEIQDRAYSVGYDTPSLLNKGFKQFFGINPSDYRNDKNYTIMETPRKTSTLKLKEPKIQELPDRTVIYTTLVGNYKTNEYGTAWEQLWGQVKEQKLFTKGIEHLGVSHDDPYVTEADKCRYDACLVIHKPAEPKGNIGVKTIKGGKFAVFMYQGSYDFLNEAYDYIYGEWLLNNKVELRNDVPSMEKYISNPNRVAPEKLKTEIYLPIQ